MSALRHVAAIALLPVMAAVVVPALLAGGSDPDPGLPAVPGVVLVAVGLALFVWTVFLFVRIGRGTLAPWDPTSRLVVRGPYRHVRNPMISGVLFVLVGEAAILESTRIAVWAAVFFAVNAIYMPLFEEPGLRRRFGADYDAYAAHVPRWLPSLHGWDPPASGAGPRPTRES